MRTNVPVLLRAFGKPLSLFSFFLFPVILNTSIAEGKISLGNRGQFLAIYNKI